METYVKYLKSTDTDSGPSPIIWGDMPNLVAQPEKGYYFFDDFVDLPSMPTITTSAPFGRYKAYAESGMEIETVSALVSTETPGGIIRLGGGDGDGDNGVIGTASCPFLLTSTSKKLWFEARIAVTSIASGNLHFFVGLAENDTMTFGDGVPLGDANATSNTGAMIGFNRLEDGTSTLNASYADHGTSWVDIKAGVGTLVAATWMKVGFVFDVGDATNTIKFYVNGAKSSTVMSASTLAARTYLDAVGLGPCIAAYADSTGYADHVYMDWWRCAQLR